MTVDFSLTFFAGEAYTKVCGGQKIENQGED